ncbi:unnamed protein product [Calypogeia fissa]
MGERKVLNKYYPPDFDPAKIPRRRQPKNLQIKVRMMLPMSIRCNTCGNYIYKGTKFNSRKEDCVGETYLGIQILRFYFKCSRCSAELTMKTDPQNSDYTMESGATRNFEPWRATDEAVDAAKTKREAEEMGDAMKALENRTLDSKQEMDIMAALDEMKSMRSRHAGVGTAEMLEALNKTREEKQKDLADEDEAVLRSVVFQNSSNLVRRIDDDEFDDDIEDYFFEEELQQQERKRKGESLERKLGEKKNGGLQGVNSSLEHIPETVEKGNQPKKKASPIAPAFAVRPKPVAFSVKPKVSSSTAIEEKIKSVISTGNSSNDIGKPETVENVNGKAEAPGTGLSALGLAYDSDSD